MATQAERRASTRAAIIAAATDLFVERGYEATAIGDIVARAGVSRGALYHHFPGKDDVFAAVFVATSSASIRCAGTEIPADGTRLDALVHACLAWLDIVTEPAVSRILLEDGPVALGFARAAALEDATSLGAMRRAVAAAVEADEIEVASVDLAARLINAVVAGAALNVRDGIATTSEAGELVEAMIRGLGRS